MSIAEKPTIVTVKRKGREAKFNRGEAVKMRAQDPEDRISNYAEVNLGYDEQEALLEAYRCIECAHKPCLVACPSNQNVPEYIKALATQDYDTAARIILEDNPLPETCGRVCPAFCESACVRGKKSDPVQIASLKRAAMTFTHYHQLPTVEGPGNKVAVIGAGPAGMACAFYLARRGFAPTVFEREAEAGGVIRYLIPPYRMPDEALAKDIQRIVDYGVEMRFSQELGKDFTISDLFAFGYEAVMVGIGCWRSKSMPLEGVDSEGVMGALDFLRATNEGRLKAPPKVAVIGAGSTAMDCVRSALRVGAAESTVVYRRTFDEMTADKRELAEAKEEGVIFKLLTLPTRVLTGADGEVTGLVCQQMRLGEPDASGRPRPEPVPDSEFTIAADLVIIAVSQQAELEWNQPGEEGEEALALNRWNTLEVDEETLATNRSGVFAAGDIVTGPHTIVEAIAQGKRAGHSIVEYLAAKHGFEVPELASVVPVAAEA